MDGAEFLGLIDRENIEERLMVKRAISGYTKTHSSA
jgi:hypothetical protein